MPAGAVVGGRRHTRVVRTVELELPHREPMQLTALLDLLGAVDTVLGADPALDALVAARPGLEWAPRRSYATHHLWAHRYAEAWSRAR